jgi:DNA-binding MarR family transcriptional regulator
MFRLLHFGQGVGSSGRRPQTSSESIDAETRVTDPHRSNATLTLLDDQHLQGLADFRVAMRRFLAASEAISRSGRVTQQQYQAMLAVRTWKVDGGMAIKDLSETLLLTHHAAVQLVNRLTKAGLAVRAPSRADRRSVLVRLTPGGEALLEKLAALHLAEMLRQEPLLSESLRGLRSLRPNAA